MSDLTLAVAVVLGAVAASALLAAIETAATRIDVVRALRLDEEDRRGAGSLLWLVEHRAAVVDAVLLATISVRVMTTLGAWSLVGALGADSDRLVRGLATLAVVVVVSMVLGEVVPRTVTARWLEPVGLSLAIVGRSLVRVVGPLAGPLATLGRSLVPRRPSDADADGDSDAEEEVGEVVDEEVEPEERRMIRSILGLGDTIAREIMVPRPDMVTVSRDDDVADVIALVVAEGRSRLPVHDPADPDTIVGIVHAKDLLARMVAPDAAGAPSGWGDLVRTPTVYPETKRADDLLRDLQRTATHLALLVDEYGEIVGLVTIEDILEEIVGEIVDEHDEAEDLVEHLPDGRIRVDGRLAVDELAELIGAELPEEPWDTAGGLVLGSLGRPPRAGDRLELEGWRFRVERTQGRRVAKLVLERLDGGDGPADGGPATATVTRRSA
jgi:CBS domain containing-hemolysin-like protein